MAIKSNAFFTLNLSDATAWSVALGTGSRALGMLVGVVLEINLNLHRKLGFG